MDQHKPFNDLDGLLLATYNSLKFARDHFMLTIDDYIPFEWDGVMPEAEYERSCESERTIALFEMDVCLEDLQSQLKERGAIP